LSSVGVVVRGVKAAASAFTGIAAISVSETAIVIMRDIVLREMVFVNIFMFLLKIDFTTEDD